MKKYDQGFFDYVNSGAVTSAEHLLPTLLAVLPIASVLDVGCGQGAWLSVWRALGVDAFVGVDGAYVDPARLLIPRESFRSCDLAQPFDLAQRFDLVQCLEVAEHLPKTRAAGFVANLVRHGDIILFSAAPKGQGGDQHVNEQEYDYWRHLFADHGYEPFDYVRPQVIADLSIEPWYRYNPILYVSRTRLSQLPLAITRTCVPADQPIPDLSPWPYRIRKRLVRLLPVAAMTRVARLKEKLVTRVRAGVAP